MHYPSRLYTQASLLISSYVICLFASSPAFAQDAALRGRVLDPDGRPIVGATVVVEGPADELMHSEHVRKAYLGE